MAKRLNKTLFLGRCGILILILTSLSCNFPIVEPIELPEARFGGIPSVCVSPCTQSFVNLSRFASRFEWDFGDNSAISRDANPTHVFDSIGSFTVSLIAFGNDDLSDTTSQTIRITNDIEAEFTFDNNTCVAPCTKTFTNTSKEADTYLWDFGDGNTSTDEDPTHTYTQPGIYTVILTASRNGQEDTEDKEVNISPITFYKVYNKGLNLGPATDVLQMEDLGFVLVGYQGQIIRTDALGNDDLWSKIHSASSNVNYYGLIQDLEGNLVVIENEAKSFFDRSSASLIKIDTTDGNILGTPLSLMMAPHEGLASDIALDSLTGDYLISGDMTSNEGMNDASLFMIRQSPQGNTTLNQYPQVDIAIGGEIYDVPGLGIVVGGQEFTTDISSRMYVNNLLFEIDNKGIRYASFTPLKAGGFAVLEGEYGGLLHIWQLSSSGSWLLNPIKISHPAFTQFKAMKIIERKEGGFAGVALAKNGFLIQNEDIKTPSAIFFLTDNSGNVLQVKTIGSANTSDFLFNIIQTQDGGYAIVGSENGSPLLIKADAAGNF